MKRYERTGCCDKECQCGGEMEECTTGPYILYTDHLAALPRWRPISEAPKDGTAILALLPLSDVPSAIRWDKAEGRRCKPCWRICWDGMKLGKYDQPTHFMPLLDGPE